MILIFEDLGAYEHLLSAIRRRAQEMDPISHLQFIVFILGLFHLKIAAADATWRIFVAPSDARKDPTSFGKLLNLLRPHDSSKLIANAKFRQQHESITHIGAVLRLDVES